MNDNEREVSTPEWAQKIIDSLNNLSEKMTAPKQEIQQETEVEEVVIPTPPKPTETETETEDEILIEEVEEQEEKPKKKSFLSWLF